MLNAVDRPEAAETNGSNEPTSQSGPEMDSAIAHPNRTDSPPLHFSDAVQRAINCVRTPSDHPLDAVDFDPVAHINRLFPSEQSLTAIDQVIQDMERVACACDADIRRVVRAQADPAHRTPDGHAALRAAHQLIAALCTQIGDIQRRAAHTETAVRQITRDIKQLDSAKHNLTAAITTLNHLHMLVGGLDQLIRLTEQRRYAELLNPLQAITAVSAHFQPLCATIEPVAQLAERVQHLHDDLAARIDADVRAAFRPGQPLPDDQLAAACRVLSTLDARHRDELLRWLVDGQLAEYEQLFEAGQDLAGLDRIDRRYAWLKRHLLAFEQRYAAVFPADWALSERIAVRFCRLTGDQLHALLAVRPPDAPLLLYAIGRTVEFEALLDRRFASASFVGQIGARFDGALDIYTQSVADNLAAMLDRFAADGLAGDSPVAASCADLFVFYKKCLVQCAALGSPAGNARVLLALGSLFGRYLRAYAERLLEPQLTAQGNAGAFGTAAKDHLQLLTAQAGNVLHSLLKEPAADDGRYTGDQLRRLCGVLATAEYCADTVPQLQRKLNEKLTGYGSVDLDAERERFQRIVGGVIRLLVDDLAAACAGPLASMQRIVWPALRSVGDQSAYVTQLDGVLRRWLPTVRDALAGSRRYYAQLCGRFVTVFVGRYVTALLRLRPVSDDGDADGRPGVQMGCEQLLLDAHSVKTILLALPSIGSEVQRKAPASYVKLVLRACAQPEAIVKLVMAPLPLPVTPDAARTFAEQFGRMLPDSGPPEFQRVLDMRAIGRRTDQQPLLDAFRRVWLRRTEPTVRPPLDDDWPDGPDGQTVATSGGHMRKLAEALIKKRLPNVVPAAISGHP